MAPRALRNCAPSAPAGASVRPLNFTVRRDRVRRHAYFLAIVVPAVALSGPPAAVPSVDAVPSYVALRFKESILRWLSHHSDYRLAKDSDCSCDDDLAQARAGWPPEWPPAPDYHPYYIVGDFRGDGAEDVAVGVISQQHPNKFRVLIIHGRPPSGTARKAFLSEELDFRQGLFYGAPRPKPWRLGVGPFESDGVTFEPTRDGYRFSSDDDD